LVRDYYSPLKWGTEHLEDRELGSSGQMLLVQLVRQQPTSAQANSKSALTKKFPSKRKPNRITSNLAEVASHIDSPSLRQTPNVVVNKQGVSPRENRGLLSGIRSSDKTSQVTQSVRERVSQSISQSPTTFPKHSNKTLTTASVVPKPSQANPSSTNQTANSGVRLAGRLLPEYPAKARRLGWEGECRARVGISADGSVTDVVITASSGHDILDASAIKALSSAVFSPKRVLGIPKASTKNYRFSFRLSGGVSTDDSSAEVALPDIHHEH
jgi:TonB family protein